MAELALFPALQEALSNVLRHAQARSVDIGISVSREGVLLEVRDDGRGPNGARPEELERGGHMGLAGMRERIGALGGIGEGDAKSADAGIQAEREKFTKRWYAERRTVPPTMFVLLGPRLAPGFDMTDLATGGRDLLVSQTVDEDAPESAE